MMILGRVTQVRTLYHYSCSFSAVTYYFCLDCEISDKALEVSVGGLAPF